MWHARTALARVSPASCAGSSSARRTRLVAPGGAFRRHDIGVLEMGESEMDLSVGEWRQAGEMADAGARSRVQFAKSRGRAACGARLHLTRTAQPPTWQRARYSEYYQ
jgi:hypothetical protein